jgi:hypothetical protein
MGSETGLTEPAGALAGSHSRHRGWHRREAASLARCVARAIDRDQRAVAFDAIAARAAGLRMQGEDRTLAFPAAFLAKVFGSGFVEERFDQLVLRGRAGAVLQAQAGVDTGAIGAGDHALPDQHRIGAERIRCLRGRAWRIAACAQQRRDGAGKAPAEARDAMHAAIVQQRMPMHACPAMRGLHATVTGRCLRCKRQVSDPAHREPRMRFAQSPLRSLRRHAWLFGFLLLLVLGYFLGIGWVARQLRVDLAHTVQAAPMVSDRQHRRE